jgi:hypothetical protein
VKSTFSLFTILMRFVLLRVAKNTRKIKIYPDVASGIFAFRNMEQHPVPQNVTTFQFRLIGDMTIKQFGFLAGGAILAYIMYRLPLPVFFTWPLAALFGLGGIGLAFVPIEERPMDVWIVSFIRSIYNPTQYVWTRKTEAARVVHQPPAQTPTAPPAAQRPVNPAPASQKGSILNTFFLPTPPRPGGEPGRTAGGLSPVAPNGVRPPTQKRSMFDWLISFLTPKQNVARPQTPPPILPGNTQWSPMRPRHEDFSPPPVVKPVPRVAQKLKDTEQKEVILEDKLKKLRAELQEKSSAESRAAQLQTQLAELLAEREKMAQELDALRKQPAPTPAEPTHPPHLSVSDGGQATTTTTQTPKIPTIQIIAPGRAANVGLPRLTTFPNVVTGIVKDKDKNLLPGVIVTVKDKGGVPLRALKTNRLGQFAASTQLPNGTYLVEIEDPRFRYTFDRAQITLNGSIVPAIEIFAKTEKEITRAKLEKELFGKPNT